MALVSPRHPRCPIIFQIPRHPSNHRYIAMPQRLWLMASYHLILPSPEVRILNNLFLYQTNKIFSMTTTNFCAKILIYVFYNFTWKVDCKRFNIFIYRMYHIWKSNVYNYYTLWPSEAITLHKSGSTLVQVMACCLAAPSHYPNQCWLIISKIHDTHLIEISQKATFVINH